MGPINRNKGSKIDIFDDLSKIAIFDDLSKIYIFDGLSKTNVFDDFNTHYSNLITMPNHDP